MADAEDDDSLWSVSGGLMSQQFSFAEKVRQARNLDQILENFASSDEEDGEEDRGDLEAATERHFQSSLMRTARRAARAAVWPGTASDHASDASTTLYSGSECSDTSNTVPQSSAGSVSSYASAQSSGSYFSQRSGLRSHLSAASSICSSPPSSSGSFASSAATAPPSLASPRRLPPLSSAGTSTRLPPLRHSSSTAYHADAAPAAPRKGPLERALTGDDDDDDAAFGHALEEEEDDAWSTDEDAAPAYSGSPSSASARPRSGLRWRPANAKASSSIGAPGSKSAAAEEHEAAFAY